MQVMKWCGSSGRRLKLLKISSLKAEQKQAFVGVLNTDAWLSDSAVGVLVDFGFSLDVEDFDLRFQRFSRYDQSIKTDIGKPFDKSISIDNS